MERLNFESVILPRIERLLGVYEISVVSADFHDDLYFVATDAGFILKDVLVFVEEIFGSRFSICSFSSDSIGLVFHIG